MVNLTDPNSYPLGGRTWAVAFIGTAGDLPLLEANGEGLLPEPSPVSRTLSNVYNNHTEEETMAYWPTDAAAITVWEAQRGESAAEAQTKGGGRASGTVDLAFDVDGDGLASQTATVSVDSSASEVQDTLRALGGLLQEVNVSTDNGVYRARNGGEGYGATPQAFRRSEEVPSKNVCHVNWYQKYVPFSEHCGSAFSRAVKRCQVCLLLSLSRQAGSRLWALGGLASIGTCLYNLSLGLLLNTPAPDVILQAAHGWLPSPRAMITSRSRLTRRTWGVLLPSPWLKRYAMQELAVTADANIAVHGTPSVVNSINSKCRASDTLCCPVSPLGEVGQCANTECMGQQGQYLPSFGTHHRCIFYLCNAGHRS